MQARPTTLLLQDLSWQGKPQSNQQKELEEKHDAEGNKSQQDDEENQAIKIESRVSLQGFAYVGCSVALGMNSTCILQ